MTSSSSEFDAKAYRKALGGFATGVCVVTAHTAEGPLGITVNSFTSVSLDPPLVLWCMDVKSDRHDAFAGAERFAVHVLPVEDQAMSDRFACGVCTLSDDEFEVGDPAPPRLRNAVTRLDCTTHDRIVMGDHLVIVGRVAAFDTHPGDALTYFRGKYGQAVDPGRLMGLLRFLAEFGRSPRPAVVALGPCCARRFEPQRRQRLLRVLSTQVG